MQLWYTELQLLIQQIEIAFEYPFRHCLLQILTDESEERRPASGGGRTVTLEWLDNVKNCANIKLVLA